MRAECRAGVGDVDVDGGIGRAGAARRCPGEPLPVPGPRVDQPADVRGRLVDRDRGVSHPRRRPRHYRGAGWLGAHRGYALTQTVAMPVVGKLGEQFGEMRVFVISVLVFVVGSALCGLATSVYMLIACGFSRRSAAAGSCRVASRSLRGAFQSRARRCSACSPRSSRSAESSGRTSGPPVGAHLLAGAVSGQRSRWGGRAAPARAADPQLRSTVERGARPGSDAWTCSAPSCSPARWSHC